MRRRWTRYKDKNGRRIYEGDTFRWTLPKGWVSPYLFVALSADTTTTSRVVRRGQDWYLVGVGKDEGWSCLLHNKRIPRNEYGEVLDATDTARSARRQGRE